MLIKCLEIFINKDLKKKKKKVLRRKIFVCYSYQLMGDRGMIKHYHLNCGHYFNLIYNFA